MQIGNKIEVVKRLLEVVDYIEGNQNSPDMQPFKEMIVKMSATMLSTLRDESVPGQHLAQPAQPAEVECDDCECDTTQCETPQYNLQETIDNIKAELKEGK